VGTYPHHYSFYVNTTLFRNIQIFLHLIIGFIPKDIRIFAGFFGVIGKIDTKEEAA
jgi:hypothetical protein